MGEVFWPCSYYITLRYVTMNPLAEVLNQVIFDGNPAVVSMLSQLGRQLFFPKGILSQSAEAKEKGHRINATIGIAKEDGHTMYLDSILEPLAGIAAGDSLTYAPAFGLPQLRKLWQDDLYAKNPSLKGKAISLPVATCGITHGVSLVADLWVDSGDVVLLPDKFWGNYANIFSLRRGARLSHYSLFNRQGGFDLQAFEEALNRESQDRQKLIAVLNFPQNPTGYTLTQSEANAIVEILVQKAEQGKHLLVVLDDAYFGLFYEAQTMKESLFARLCDCHHNLLAIKLDGATKEDFVWGLRVGFITYAVRCAADPKPVYVALEKKTAGCVRSSISNASHLSQTLIARAMQNPRHAAEKQAKFNILKSRALKVKQVLADPKYSSAFQAYPFNSGYFMCLRLLTVEAEPLRVHLLERYGVGLIALGQHDLRVAFSCIDEEQIPELFNIILQGVQDLESG